MPFSSSVFAPSFLFLYNSVFILQFLWDFELCVRLQGQSMASFACPEDTQTAFPLFAQYSLHCSVQLERSVSSSEDQSPPLSSSCVLSAIFLLSFRACRAERALGDFNSGLRNTGHKSLSKLLQYGINGEAAMH